MLGYNRGGTIEERRITLKDEIGRIVQCSLAIFLCVSIFTATLILDSIIYGPILGTLLITVTLAVLSRYLLLPWISSLTDDRESATLATTMAISVILIVAAPSSYLIFSRYWLPYIRYRPIWYIYLLYFVYFALTLAAKVVLSMAIYLFAGEAFDPNGPTTTRKPADYTHIIWPWTHTTDAPTYAPVPSRTIRIEDSRIRPNHRLSERYPTFPDTPQWQAYAQALSLPQNDARDPSATCAVSFSETSAKSFGISPVDKRDRRTGMILEPGFRSVRDSLIDQEYISWNNPAAHAQGYTLTEEFFELMRAWGADS